MTALGVSGKAGQGNVLLRFLLLAILSSCVVSQTASWPGDLKYQNTDRRNVFCDRQSEIDAGLRNFKDGLQGLDVSIVMHVQSPGWAEQMDNGTLAGLHIRLLDLVAARAGFTWRNSFAIVDPPDTLNTNETWTSWLLWGAENYDVVLEWFNDKPSRRSEGVTFSHHFLDQSLYLVAQRSQKQPPLSRQLFQFVEPFDGSVWLLILGSIVVTGIVYTLMEAQVGDDFAHYQDPPDRHVNHKTGALRHGLYLSFGSITGAGDLAPHSNFGKLFKCSWALVAFFILSTYTANLASFLFDRSGWSYEVSSIKDANNRKLPICVQAGSSNEEHLQDVYLQIDIQQSETAVGALQDVRNGNCRGAVVGNSEWMEVEIDENANGPCDMGLVGQPFKRWGASWGSKSDSGVRCTVLVSEIFSLHLQEIEKEGILETEFEKYLISRSKKTCPEQPDQAGGATSLRVAEVGGIYIIHVAFCIFCLIGHWNDRVYHKVIKEKRRKRHSMDSYHDSTGHPEILHTPVNVSGNESPQNGGNSAHRLLPPPRENGGTAPHALNGGRMNGIKDVLELQDGKDYPREYSVDWHEVPNAFLKNSPEKKELERQSREIEALRGQMSQMAMDNAKMIRMLCEIDTRLGGAPVQRNKVAVVPVSGHLLLRDTIQARGEDRPTLGVMHYEHSRDNKLTEHWQQQTLSPFSRDFEMSPHKSPLRETMNGRASFDETLASARLGFPPDFGRQDFSSVPLRVVTPHSAPLHMPTSPTTEGVYRAAPGLKTISMSQAPDANLVSELVETEQVSARAY